MDTGPRSRPIIPDAPFWSPVLLSVQPRRKGYRLALSPSDATTSVQKERNILFRFPNGDYNIILVGCYNSGLGRECERLSFLEIVRNGFLQTPGIF
ncbi:hypothetical protein CUMW_081860 [Citrus unshiu]|nr:hypothetical protein CUMW_081860 [Citrus unshiu]